MWNTVWSYWEVPKGTRHEPAYVTLCRWTMLHNLKNACLVCVNPQNVDLYLPGILAQTADIQAHDRGRMDRLRRLLHGDPRSIAIRSDIFRANLLHRYGGLWIDADAIVLGDLQPYFDLLVHHEFFIVKRQSHGKSHVSVNFYGSRPKGTIISKYVEVQRRKYSRQRVFDFTAMGDVSLNPVVAEHPDLAVMIPEREVQPVTYEESNDILMSQTAEPGDVLKGHERVVMLYHGIFRGPLGHCSIDELYGGDRLVSKLFRKALPENSFREFRNEQRQNHL